MLKQKKGNIINISSIGGQTGGVRAPHYAAAKSAIISLTRSFANLLSKSNVRVNCIAPGPIQTDLLRGITDTQIKKITSQQVIPKQFQKEDVCDLVEILLDQKASSLSGQILNIGGV